MALQKTIETPQGAAPEQISRAEPYALVRTLDPVLADAGGRLAPW